MQNCDAVNGLFSVYWIPRMCIPVLVYSDLLPWQWSHKSIHEFIFPVINVNIDTANNGNKFILTRNYIWAMVIRQK